MFNIDNVLLSPIIQHPWKHQIIENFFDTTDFEKIYNASKRLQEKYKDITITASECLSLAEVYDIIGDDVFSIILDANRKLLDNIEKIVEPYPNHNRFVNYISLPSFHILPPFTDWQKIHSEAEDKTVSIVVYLYPDTSTGTALYQENNRESFVKEIDWKPNSSMLFCGEKNVTWHDFCSRENPRVTLNFFLRTAPSTELLDEGDQYSWTFGNGLKTYIPKSLPQKKLRTLTDGYLFRKVKDGL
jgi:hypothetical protein